MKEDNDNLDFEIIDVSLNKEDFSDIEMIDDSALLQSNTINSFDYLEIIGVSPINNTITKRKSSIIYSCIFLFSILLIVFNVYIIYIVKSNDSIRLNQIIYNDAIKTCSNLFENNIIKDDIYNIDIDRCIYKIDLVENQKNIQKLKKEVYNAKEYIVLNEKIDSYYNDDILTTNITTNNITELLNKANMLEHKYKNLAISQIDEMRKEYSNILYTQNMVSSLFFNASVKANVTRKEYNEVKKKVDSLEQKDLKEELELELNKVSVYIEQKEKEEYNKQQEINNAWVKLNVPYISQNKWKVYNGCEAASMLMALKYKGYLNDVDLITFANNMPKSDNPNTGFYLDIFNIEPLNESHWIAPQPLVEYGISASGNKNIINSTGLSLDELSKEILNDNPVIIYLTSNFNEPTNWINGMAKNLHVLLITGYNPITKEFIIIDPWFYNNGVFKHQIKLDKIANIYNAIGKKSIIIR